MHSSNFKVDGKEYTVHHNGDWSGEAIIIEIDPKTEKAVREIEVPGMLLLNIARRGIFQQAQYAIEEALDTLEARLEKEVKGG